MKLAYKEINGLQPSLIFLHGLLGSKRNWNQLISRLSNRHLVLVDLLGYGDSPKPVIEYTVEEHLQALQATVKPMMTEQNIIVGHSMGALLALNYTIQNPDSVAGLVLVNPPFTRNEAELLAAMEKSSSPLVVAMLRHKLMGKWICHLHEMFPSLSLRAVRFFEPNLSEDIAVSVGQHIYESYIGSLENIILKQNIMDLLEASPRLPILVLVGEDDPYASSMKKSDFSRWSHVQLQSIKGQHNTIFQDPQELLQHLNIFLDKLACL